MGVHEGVGPGKQDGMSSAANHSDVHAGAGWHASPTAGRDEPDLHQQSSHSPSSGLAPTESQPKDCKNKQAPRAGPSGQSLACSPATQPVPLPFPPCTEPAVAKSLLPRCPCKDWLCGSALCTSSCSRSHPSHRQYYLLGADADQ